MLQLRPTFSESWYRVVDLRPKLRGTAQISRQYYRGERWYVVRDAACNQFHRLSDAAYRFVGLLDGTRTVGEAWDLVGGQLADDAPTQPEVIQILSQLYAANLVETDIPPDATVLLRRHKKQVQRKFQGRMMNILFPRIPIWDCDRFVCRWLPLVKLAFSRIGAIVWFVVVLTAIAMVVPQWTRLKAQAIEAMNISEHPQTFLWGLLVFWIIKFFHECGHAFGCRRFGGEVHEMGIMFLVFVPTPYVDASTAWAFPNKWARMFVGAAGMIVEVFIAAICAIIWVNISNPFWSDILCYVMIIASVTTVMFNANPLLRYDGYYMLSDYLEIPNLQMRSREYLLGLIKRHIFRLKPSQPLPPVGQRVLLFFYGLSSTIYRVFVGIVIILVVTWQVPVLGVLMAIGGVITWLVAPLVKLFKYLTIEPELHRKRGRAWVFTGVVATLVVLLVGFVKFPRSITAEGVVATNEKEVLFAKWDGWVRQIKVKDGQQVKAGDALVVCDDPELDTQIAFLETRVAETELQIQMYREREGAKVAPAEQTLSTLRKRLEDALKQKRELTVTASIDGQFVGPNIKNAQDRFLQRGVELGRVVQSETLMIKAVISQQDALSEVMQANDSNTEVRLIGAPWLTLHALETRVIPAGQNELPHQRLTQHGGGEIPVDPRDPKGTKPLVEQFELRAVVKNVEGRYQPGQGAWVKVSVSDEPLFNRWRDRFLQLINNSSSRSPWL